MAFVILLAPVLAWPTCNTLDQIKRQQS